MRQPFKVRLKDDRCIPIFSIFEDSTLRVLPHLKMGCVSSLVNLTRARMNLKGVGFRRRPHDEGMRAASVETALTLTIVERENNLLNFTSTEMEHQILATLSSYRPRANGNSRCKTCRVRFQSPRNGNQQTTNVPMTAAPSSPILFTQSLPPAESAMLLPRR